MAEKPSGASPATYAGFGIQFLVAILIFAYVGNWADKHLHTAPLLLIVGIFLGAGGTGYSMYRRVMADARAGRGSR